MNLLVALFRPADGRNSFADQNVGAPSRAAGEVAGVSRRAAAPRVGPRLLAALALLGGGLLQAAEIPAAQDLLQRFRALSGGERWAQVAAIEASGQIGAGGLSGTITMREDLRQGRFFNRFELGPAQGGNGWDGELAWELHSDGAVVELTQAAALRRNVSDRWMARRGYLAPDLLGASAGPVSVESIDGVDHRLLTLTPPGGEPVELAFDGDGWLREIRNRIDDRLIRTQLMDYRSVEGLQLPHRLRIDQGDPRLLSTLEWTTIRPLSSADAATLSYARPQPKVDFRFADGQPVELPFELINNHIYLQVLVDGQPLRMLFDTGGVNLLTPKAAERLGLASSGQLAARGVGEKAQDVGFAQASSLNVGGFELDQPLFFVIDLAPMMPVEGIDFDGLVGFELFKRAVVQIDYPARRLRLYPNESAPEIAGWPLPFVLDDRIPVIEGELDGRPLKLSVDTGSRAALTVHSPFARTQQLEQHYATAPLSVNGWGVGGSLSSKAFRVGRLQLGPIAIEGVTADMYLGDKGAFAKAETDANLGSGLLKAFVATFDYANRRLTLAGDPKAFVDDGYDRLGAWLNLAADGSLEVAAVTVDAPAAEAGLEAGDRITHLAGQPVAERSLAQWRAWARQLPEGKAVAVRLGDGRALEVVARELVPGEEGREIRAEGSGEQFP